MRLSGRWVDLVPTSPEHHEGLVRAVEDGELWQLWYTGVPRPEDVAAHIDRVLGLQAKGSMLPFTGADKARGCVAGMTTCPNVDLDGPRLEIGATWDAKGSQRTPLNTEAKLLLTHASQALGRRVPHARHEPPKPARHRAPRRQARRRSAPAQAHA